MAKTAEELHTQWANPGDILSILLLIGGDIVQKAIAQLVGHTIRLPGRRRPGLPIAPVAFSFGWAAYGFTNLLAAVGDMRLMPTADHPSVVVNCSNGFVRETRSWVLGRLLRDHEIRYPVDSRSTDEGGRAESVRIDIFHLGPASTPCYDFVWWSGWGTLLMQIGIAIIPWVLYGDWGVILVALCGIALVALTCAMPQWEQEKWSGRTLERQKVTCVTRGNGHPHIMVLIGLPGSWDLESLAVGASHPRPETRWLSLVLAILWTCLLISISGLQQRTWFLVGIGGLGMLQNVFAAGTPRAPGASNFHITEFSRAPTIVGRREYYRDEQDAHVNLRDHDAELANLDLWVSGKAAAILQPTQTTLSEPPKMPPWVVTMSKEDGVPAWLEPRKPARSSPTPSHSKPTSSKLPSSTCGIPVWSSTDCSRQAGVIHAVGVHGALIELEKWVPTAGLAMVQIFFPGGLTYNDASIRDNTHKKFWKRAHHTVSTRKKAEGEDG